MLCEIFISPFVYMRKQIKIKELTDAISIVLSRLYKERSSSILNENNEYFSEIGKNLGLERYTSSDHNITISKLFAICDFLDISLSDFLILVEKENKNLIFNQKTKGVLVKKFYSENN